MSFYYLFISVLSVWFLQKSEKVGIMAIGDSITQGGKTTVEEYTYRLPLQQLLAKEGIPFDFIGSRKSGLHADAIWPPVNDEMDFDPDHEGYYGKKTRYVSEQVMLHWDEHGQVPDIVLIHLGTNDQKSLDYHADIFQPLRSLILFLRKKNPSVVILLGHLNFNQNENALKIRDEVNNLALLMDSSESPVKTVDHYEGWNEDPSKLYTDTFDWAHPNLKGQEKMARKWFEAMRNYLN
jgi:acyl-CoA thioesterase I